MKKPHDESHAAFLLPIPTQKKQNPPDIRTQQMRIFGYDIFSRASREQKSEQRSDTAAPASSTFDLLNGGWMRLFGSASKAGVHVNQENALGLSAVYAAVDRLSSAIATLPWKVYENLANGDRELAFTNAIYALLSTNPHAHYTPFNFKKALMCWVLLHGNAYAYIMRDANGRVVGLKILKATEVQPFCGSDDRLRYQIHSSNMGSMLIDAQDMLHIPGLSFDGIKGRSPIADARESLGAAIAAQQYGSNVYKDGAFMNGILSSPLPLKAQQREQVEQVVRERYSGANNGKIPVFGGDLKYYPISLSPRDAQFVESTKMGIEDVARIFNIPLHMLGSLGDATFNNITTLSQEFVKYSLMPWILKFEEEANRKLFRQDEMGRFYSKMSVSALLRGDFKTRTEGYRTLWNLGAISANEIRRLEDMNSIPNGDTYYVPLNFVDDKKATDEQDEA